MTDQTNTDETPDRVEQNDTPDVKVAGEKVGAMHRAFADYVNTHTDQTVTAEQVFAVISTRVAFRKTEEYRTGVRAARDAEKAEAAAAAEALKAQKAKEREEAKAKRDAEKAEADAKKAADKAEREKVAAEKAEAKKAADEKKAAEKAEREAEKAKRDAEKAATS